MLRAEDWGFCHGRGVIQYALEMASNSAYIRTAFQVKDVFYEGENLVDYRVVGTMFLADFIVHLLHYVEHCDPIMEAPVVGRL